jgi:conjugal transfer/type IV secretion protein DotA/TraY
MIAKPNIQQKDFKDLAAFFMIAHACKAAYINDKSDVGNRIDAYLIKRQDGATPRLLSSTDYFDAIDFIGESNTIRIRIGARNDVYSEQTSDVYPQCGELTMTVPDDPTSDSGLNKGGPWLNSHYYILLQWMWDALDPAYEELKTAGEDFMRSRIQPNPPDVTIDPSVKTNATKTAQDWISVALDIAAQTLVEEYEKPTNEERAKYGWGGAGIFYSEMAAMNGELTYAALNKPQVTTMPSEMVYVCEQNQQQNNNTPARSCFSPELAEGRKLQRTDLLSEAALMALSDIYDFWYKDPGDITGNSIIDTINVILGTTALFDMCKNIDVHPLAQLSVLGKGLVDASIRNFAGGALAGILSAGAGYFGPALSAASSFATSIASITILMGFILFYIVPFMPFLYFLFAVGGWVKGLFEAMVGIPLWALAHIRIDGEGLPGDAASNGYFLVFEIFVRPILIVFGLLASLLIFSAMVKVLNEIFHLAVSNLSGFDPASESLCGNDLVGGGTPPVGSVDYFRGPVDEFFFTIVYAILVYMIAMSSFKLIDMIPNQILRWMGAGVQTFGDTAGEPAEGLVSKMAIGGGMLSQVAGGVGGNLQKAVSSGAKGVAERMSQG